MKENPDISGGIGLPDLQLMGCLAFCYIVMFVILCKGAQGAGKAAYFTALFPYVVLFTLLVRGVTLPGAMKGIMFYITPQWGELLNIKVRILASDIFFQLVLTRLFPRFGTRLSPNPSFRSRSDLAPYLPTPPTTGSVTMSIVTL